MFPLLTGCVCSNRNCFVSFRQPANYTICFVSKSKIQNTLTCCRWVLEQPGVASVVVGMRDAKNVPDNILAFSFELSVEDNAEIDAVLQQATPSKGDVYHRERGV